MSRYYTDLAEERVFRFPAGWTRRWDLAESFTSYSVRTRYRADAKVKNRVLRYLNASVAATDLLSFDAVDADTGRGNAHVLTHFEGIADESSVVAPHQYIVYTRASGATAAARTGLRLLVTTGTHPTAANQYFLQSVAAGVVTTIASGSLASLGASFASSPFYCRFETQDQVGSPSTVTMRFKLWHEDDAEPDAWFASADTAALFGVNGWVGFSLSGATGGSTYGGRVNFFSVGTGGDAPVEPITNAEFEDWLDNPNKERRVLAELTAIGYNASGTYKGRKYVAVPSMVGSPTVIPVRCADNSALAVSGDIALKLRLRLADYTGVSTQTLAAKWKSSGVSSDKSWIWQLSATGFMQFAINQGGVTWTSTVALSSVVANGADVSVMVVVDLNTGAGASLCTFFYSLVDEQNWTPLGDPVYSTSVSSINSSTATNVTLGTRHEGDVPIEGSNNRFYWFEIRNGSTGALVAWFNPDEDAAVGDTSWRSTSTDEEWILGSGASVAQPTTLWAQRKLYVANGGYNSHAQDTPASQFYNPWITKIPTYTRDMPTAMSGEATLSFGALRLSNPRPDPDAPGLRDVLFRMKWERDYAVVLMGDPEWPRHDFRVMIFGRLKPPTAPAQDEIEFGLSDLSDAFDVPAQDHRYGSEAPALLGQFKPLLLGQAEYIEAPRRSTSGTEYDVHDGPIILQVRSTDFNSDVRPPIFDNFVSLVTGPLTVSAVDTGTDLITLSGAHGASVNSRLRFTAGTPPAPLVTNVDYFAVSLPSGVGIGLSASPSGALINLTVGTTGATCYLQHWHENANLGFVELVANPAGRIVVGCARQSGQNDFTGRSRDNIPGMVDYLLFDRVRANGKPLLTHDRLDQESFAALNTSGVRDTVCGTWLDTQQHLLREVMNRIFNQGFVWGGWTPDGRFQLGALQLPEDALTTKLIAFGFDSDWGIEATLNESAISGLSLKSIVYPTDWVGAQVAYRTRHYTGGVPQSTNPEFTKMFDLYPMATPAEPAVTSPPTALDSYKSPVVRTPPPNITLFWKEDADLPLTDVRDIFQTQLGVWEFRTKLTAMLLSIGSVISLTCDRFEWTSYSAALGYASPDSVDNANNQYAVVIGIELDLSQVFPVRLTVFRPMAGYWPTQDINTLVD
jgi:hypothetical protein